MRRRIAVEPIPVVDLFAGPGGLGEGFSSLGPPTSPVFQVKVSAEMDPAAHKTLRLRAYYRALKRSGDRKLIQLYYDYCNGNRASPYDEISRAQQEEAEREAQCLTLGDPESDRKLYAILDDLDLPNRPWVLIGGPPCQAYSLVGRSRNRGKEDYVAEQDHRHFLYREYLKIIQRYRPFIFVMENVKGLLSSKVGEQRIFHKMLVDLADPNTALGRQPRIESGLKYRIHSLVSDSDFDSSKDPDEVDSSAFVVRAEDYGVPQARHRVILLGVCTGLEDPRRLVASRGVTLESVIRRLPKLRSRVSRCEDSQQKWETIVRGHAVSLANAAARAGNRPLAAELRRIAIGRFPRISGAGKNLVRTGSERRGLGKNLAMHFRDDDLHVWLNHEARGHMTSDLRRYLYAATYAGLNHSSPKGHKEFDLPGLAPDHENWESGKFADRFRVQVWPRPATTVTSHISKDGHYYIHPDSTQCRSLTVREAARIQTFPDNYLFCGNRTEQYVQVGNAVPPYLAHQIACIVLGMLQP